MISKYHRDILHLKLCCCLIPVSTHFARSDVFFRNTECHKIRSLLQALQLILKDLKENSMEWLKPSMRLVGSIFEGSCLSNVNELDISLKFEALDDHPFKITNENACEIVLHEESLLVSKGYSTTSRRGLKVLDHAKFCHFLMQSLSNSVENVCKKLSWPVGLKKTSPWQFGQCCSCILESNMGKTSLYSPATHCQSCYPTVCHTKVGPCLIFNWGHRKNPLVVDVVPVYPFVSSNQGLLPLFGAVTETLTKKKPENWSWYHRKIIRSERLLPEYYAKCQSMKQKQIFHMPIKLLNYSPENNHIIRPGMSKFSTSDELNTDLFSYCKAVKHLLPVKMDSYQIKRVVLSDEVMQKLCSSDVLMDEALCVTLGHPELREYFEPFIDFPTWERTIERSKRARSRSICQEIPLKQ